jgi:hypothetical protein
LAEPEFTNSSKICERIAQPSSEKLRNSEQQAPPCQDDSTLGRFSPVENRHGVKLLITHKRNAILQLAGERPVGAMQAPSHKLID